jgi:MoaA/NifB/PqqE/SkfB family radical SAM enzyme
MEPLLPNNRPWFRPLINQAVSLNKGSVGITTNGTLLDDETVEFLSDAASKIRHPFTVNVSLDGDEDTHDQQRGGKGLWRKTTGGIRRLATAGRCNLVTNTTITSINASALPEIALISNECGARIAAFHPFESATNSGLQILELSNLVGSIRSLVEAFHRDDRIKHLVLEFEASNAGIFFHLFEQGIFEGWELIEDETGFLFLRSKSGSRLFLVSLMFHPHHFIRTMRLLHNGGFASCRSIALQGWETVGNWQMSLPDLKEACVPCLAEIWQEYLDSTATLNPETFEKFNQFILKGGE